MREHDDDHFNSDLEDAEYEKGELENELYALREKHKDTLAFLTNLLEVSRNLRNAIAVEDQKDIQGFAGALSSQIEQIEEAWDEIQ